MRVSSSHPSYLQSEDIKLQHPPPFLKESHIRVLMFIYPCAYCSLHFPVLFCWGVLVIVVCLFMKVSFRKIPSHGDIPEEVLFKSQCGKLSVRSKFRLHRGSSSKLYNQLMSQPWKSTFPTNLSLSIECE